VELEVEYRKVEANWKPLEFIVALNVCGFRIAINWAKHFEKERMDLDVRLCSQAYDFRKSIETIERLQLNVQELSCHAPITQEQLDVLQMQIQSFTQKAKEVDYSFHRMAELEVIRTKNVFMKT
jgi:FtsZ-binding cell division protein ZapB